MSTMMVATYPSRKQQRRRAKAKRFVNACRRDDHQHFWRSDGVLCCYIPR